MVQPAQPGTIDNTTSNKTATLFGAATIHLDTTINSGTTLNANNQNINAAGNWTNNGTFTAGTATVTFDGSAQQTIGGASATAFNALTVAFGANVVLPTNATATLLTNNGKIIQTQDVADTTAEVNFIDLGGYGGVTINANGHGALNSTTVTILGNQQCDTNNTSVRRCFTIDPPSPAYTVSATITFYFADTELGTQTCDNSLVAWHWDGALPWHLAGASVTQDCGSTPHSIQVAGVSSFSPILLSNGASGPTAVTMNDLTASSPASSAPMVLGVFGLFAGGLLLRRRTLRTTPN